MSIPVRKGGADSWAADARYSDLVRRRGEELRRLAMVLTGSRADGDDAFQEAVIAVARSWPTRLLPMSDQAVFAYLRKAVVRKAIDVHRSRRPSTEALDVGADDRALLRFEQDRAFFDRLQHLPRQQRAALVGRYYLDLDDGRIAQLLGVSRATVRSNAMRGLEKLRREGEQDR